MSDWDITEAMIRHGGQFAHQLGRLFRAADPVNQARLKHAFPELFAEYEELAHLKAAAPPRSER